MKQSRLSSSKNKEDLTLAITEEFFKQHDIEYLEVPYKNSQIQKFKGDYIIFDNEKKDTLSVEVKVSSFFRKTQSDVLAFDMRYLKKGTKEPYIQKGATDNKGWCYYLNADILIAINFISMKFYLISNFKRLREKIFEHLNNKTYTEHGIAIAMNKCDKCKDTVIASVDLKNIKKNLGIDVLIIDLV
ncbi:TPA: hypothetical protein ACG3PP_003804 [Clostridioides difficile]